MQKKLGRRSWGTPSIENVWLRHGVRLINYTTWTCVIQLQFSCTWQYVGVYALAPKTSTFYFLNNLVKNLPILMICGTLNPEKIWHENLTGLSTSPVRCSYFTSEIKKSHFQRYYSYIVLIICVISIIHLPASPENITTLTCELQNFFIWLKVCCVLSSVGGSEKSQSWIVVGGSAKNRLWCMATGMSGKQCHSKCSEWQPSALIHASSLFWHCSAA